MILYKYLDFDGALKTLQHCSLKATRANEFNDPFEYHLRPIVGDIRDRFKDVLRGEPFRIKKIEKIAKELLSGRGVSTPTKEEIRDTNLEARNVARDSYARDFQNKMDLRTLQRLNEISEIYASICFSKNENNNLMWSHYGDGHRGVLFEFDFSKTPKYLDHLIKMRYLKKSPEVKIKRHAIDAKDLKWNIKSNDWEYENEYRISFEMDVLNHGNTINEKGNQVELLTFKLLPEMISRVILGLKIRPEKVEKITEVLRQDQYSNVRLQYSHKQLNSFSSVYLDKDENALRATTPPAPLQSSP